jgi:hypothetical protein
MLARVLSGVGAVLLAASVGQLLWIMAGTAVRSARAWGRAARYARRAATARTAARAARDRFVREQGSDAYDELRRVAQKRVR